MNVYPSFKYQLFTQKMMVIVFYGVFLGMTLAFGSVYLISVSMTREGSSMGIGAVNGLSAATSLMVFVAGCCAFKENFAMALQNGVSRKSLFMGRLCAAVALCLILAVCDEVCTLLFSLLGKLPVLQTKAVSLFQLMYGATGNWILDALCSVAFSFFLLSAVSAMGYFSGVLFYRLSSTGKIIVGAALFFLVFFTVPLLKTIRDRFHLEPLWEALCQKVSEFFSLAFGGAPNCMASCFVLFVLFSLLGWLLMRRIPLKK